MHDHTPSATTSGSPIPRLGIRSTTREVSSQETAERVLKLMRRVSVDGLVAASCRDIADELSIGRQTALNAVRRLLDENTISVARKGTGHLYPTVYFVGGI